ncbi:DNA-binding protein [Shewanella baltica]|uniref:DNA-binding protein n=1 Tax=Shewanella TaxID=22 RepID=UPI00217D2B7D|nr:MULTISPECIES: DNA-binding protein [Shewanella]MCS6101382.1 DNA-binding protein [Shewanella baltica]MCS6184470.1 DNA-binding protein [Shewanella baltica]MCU8012533.1 DNA-binding protein [Shewanella sp. SM74]MDR9767661.1 DNA-binding protein [Shewanella baltica]
MSELVLHIGAPFITYQQYAAMSGLSLNKIQDMARQGQLPIAPKVRPKDTPLINMVALTKQANQLAEQAGY